MESKPKSYQAIGYGMAVLQAALYSMLGIFGKLVYATGLDVQQAVILRFLSTTVILGVFMLIWRKQPLISKEPAVYVQGVVFYTSSLFYFFTVERLTAGMTTVVFFTYPAVVAVASVFVFKERFTAPIVIALVLAIGGLILVSGIAAGEVVLDPLGILFGIIACLTFATYTILIQKMGRKEQPITATFTLSWVSLAASCIVFAPSVPGMFPLSLEQLGLGAAMAVLCTSLPLILFIESVKRIGATKSSLIGISETPFSLLIAFIVLGETLTLMQGIGSCLIVASIAVITIAPILSKRKAPEKPSLDEPASKET